MVEGELQVLGAADDKVVFKGDNGTAWKGFEFKTAAWAV